jgi:hypothetical protein
VSIEGRISVDVVFHDTDGTNAINVLTLKSYGEYPSGKVASFSGTADENGFALPLSPSTYRDASGQLVSFAAISKAVVKSESGELLFTRWDSEVLSELETVLGAGDIVILDLFGIDPGGGYGPSVSGRNAAAGYTILIYGT